MQFIKVKSSNIAGIFYENNTLYLQFNKGQVYSYENVPEEIYIWLLNSESKGKFFKENILNKYIGKKVEVNDDK